MKPPRKTTCKINIILISFPICILFYLLSSQFLPTNTPSHPLSAASHSPTTIQHIVFGIPSSQMSWSTRKDYIRTWWRPHHMRGCVFLDKDLQDNYTNYDDALPPVRISEDTSRFRYTWENPFGEGSPWQIRMARVVAETVALNHTNVRWFVFGDDDTLFFPDNLVMTLSKYDHGLWYFIGANSESHLQNKVFSFNMAYGGAGFAISYPLAKVLAKVLDSCLERYHHLYGSDGRISSCVAELGIGLTREPGFHQMDIRGSMFGILASHPLAPLVSLHHLDLTDPIFPNMTRTKALQHLYRAADLDPQRILQQTVCYDQLFSWTISISWGYAVQVFSKHIFLPDVLRTQVTFQPWNDVIGWDRYYFDAKEHHRDPCQRPTTFFLDRVSTGMDGINTFYKKMYENCMVDIGSPRRFEEIRVLTQKLDPDIKQAPRRQCCDVMPPSKGNKGNVMEIGIRECKEDELIYMH